MRQKNQNCLGDKHRSFAERMDIKQLHLLGVAARRSVSGGATAIIVVGRSVVIGVVVRSVVVGVCKEMDTSLFPDVKVTRDS